jgi:hypothetical protein
MDSAKDSVFGIFLRHSRIIFFSVFVHYLVKTRTDSDFLLLCAQYPNEIQKAIDHLPETGLKRVRQEFRKAGLDLI